MNINVGKRIKEIREKQSLSQQVLAERIKYLNQSQIAKIEKGYRKVTAQDLVEIAKALDVTVDELIKTA